jgi:hypothetical protein
MPHTRRLVVVPKRIGNYIRRHHLALLALFDPGFASPRSLFLGEVQFRTDA